MIEWISANLSSIVVGVFLVIALVFVVRKMVRDRKNGKNSCGSDCIGCAMRGKCNSKDSKHE